MRSVSSIDQHQLHYPSKNPTNNFGNSKGEDNTLRRVVIANVAMDRFESVINVSRSILQAVTAAGYCMATLKSSKSESIVSEIRSKANLIQCSNSCIT